MTVAEERKQLVNRLFPQGFPQLWCPLIVHYTSEGKIDPVRIRKHLVRISPYVRSFLIFGSTGDGWELSLAEKTELFACYVELAKELDLNLLIGVLKHQTEEVETEISYWLQRLTKLSNQTGPLEAMAACHVVGFTVCPPRGADLSQTVIVDALARILSRGLPVALYQLPQVTQNEISPETLYRLARDYPHFFMFKDTSGQDQVLLAGLDYAGVRFVRGMEGDYSRWYRAGQSGYDGFLLSSANCFAADLQQLIKLADQGKNDEADRLSARISDLIAAVFADVATIISGNAFANANKCIDHILAYGLDWKVQSPPFLHSGQPVPVQHLSYARQALEEHGWSADSGYLTATQNRS
ncbi:MAG: dihydrodipicolinate synthase family protein [Bacillota bacterium]|nr:dihydrodipicolinate synthase family protein [Bacillota bacterium]